MMSKIFNVNAIVIWNACNIYGIQRREKFFGLTTFASYFYFSMLHFWRYDLRYWYYVTRFFAGGPVGHKLKQILSMDWDINALLNSDGTIVRPESKISPLLLRESKNVDERKWSNAQSLKKPLHCITVSKPGRNWSLIYEIPVERYSPNISFSTERFQILPTLLAHLILLQSETN